MWFSSLDNEAAGDTHSEQELNHFALSFSPLPFSRTHIRAGDAQSAVGVKSLDLWPLPGPMRTSPTPRVQPRRQPINSRQFRTRKEGASQRLMTPLYMHFTTFCSISLISSLSSHLLHFAISLALFVFAQRPLTASLSLLLSLHVIQIPRHNFLWTWTVACSVACSTFVHGERRSCQD